MTVMTLDSLTLNITHDIHVRASIAVTFEALLEQLGPGNETPEGQPLSMVLEPRPGGRWYRDLGGDNGHFWGHVQAIKRPALVELTGPLFLSSAIMSNVQYRLKEVEGGTLISFRHTAFGFIPDELRDGMPRGWDGIFARVIAQAEGTRKTH